MINVAARLHDLCRAAGHAIQGVSIGTQADKATWRISPANLQSACQSIIDAFDLNDPAHAAAERQQERDRELAQKALKAIAIATHKRFKDKVPTDPTTAAQWEASLRAEWDAL